MHRARPGVVAITLSGLVMMSSPYAQGEARCCYHYPFRVSNDVLPLCTEQGTVLSRIPFQGRFKVLMRGVSLPMLQYPIVDARDIVADIRGSDTDVWHTVTDVPGSGGRCVAHRDRCSGVRWPMCGTP
ncbi:MAG: hypothetical protein RBS73_08325 [Prolixibacteraceae bacterium]|nr:hypothetical protein [Prolixibacteraceae bacterium]